MTEIPLWAALGFMGAVGAAAFMCAEYLEKLNKRIERQNEILAEIRYILERRFGD